MKKQILVPKPNSSQNSVNEQPHPKAEFNNKAHTTEVRFIIFKFNGEHYFNYFLQKNPVSELYNFILEKLSSFIFLKQGSKLSNDDLIIRNSETNEVILFDTITPIKDKCKGSTQGRSTLIVEIIKPYSFKN